MIKGKDIFNALIPPIVFSLFRKLKKKDVVQEAWVGDYASWNEAKIHCTGYNSDLILEKCKTSLLKVKNGEAVYERDSILFDEKQYSWGVLAGLERAALENDGKLCVLDFGGSLGSSYYQNKDFLSSIKELQWCIVEQSNFVECGREYFESDQLKFYHTIEECMAKHKPNVLFLSCVLQYLEQPEILIDKMMEMDIPYLILDRLAMSNENRDVLTIQHVPEMFYKSKLGHWFFSYDKLISKFANRYKLIASSFSYADHSLILNGKINCFFKLLIFKKIK